MSPYLVWAIVGFGLLLFEMMTPTLFCLNLSAAAFFTSIYTYFAPDVYYIQIAIFTVLSLIFILLLRPLMLSKQEKSLQTGIEGDYIGKEAMVTKPIGLKGTNGLGEIKIYGEIWQAANENGEEIPLNTLVKIIKNKGIIMYVEKKE